MENGEIIILKDMEIIYSKFYDLFNKNLQKYGNSHYARIVLDSSTNEKHIVNKNFRCIILLEQNEVNRQDPSFLNRFEKHLISFRNLLSEKQNNIAKELFEEIKDLTTIQENKRYLPLLVNINLEEIRCLLLDLLMKRDNIRNNIKEIYGKLIPTFTQENILNAIFSPQKKYIKKEDIIHIYEENTHTNIFKFLETIKNNKIVIYTFSPYYKDIFSEKNELIIKNKNFGDISKDNTVEITFNQIFSEKMLIYFFELFYKKENCNLFIIHFPVRDTKYLKYIKFQLDNYQREKKENDNKIFLFIIHIEKNLYKEKNNDMENNDEPVEFLEKYHSYFFSFLSEYQQITIDNLLGQRDISVINLFKKSNEELLNKKELIDINSIIKKEFSRQLTQMITSQKIEIIIDKLDNLSENGVLDNIIKKIQISIKNTDNILKQILIKYSSLIEKDFDFISFLIEKIEKLLSENVEILIRELGRSGYLVSYLFEKEIPKKLKGPIFAFINNINLVKRVYCWDYYSFDLKIPGSRILIKKIANLVDNCKNEYLNKEDEYRKGLNKKNNKKAKNKSLEDIHFEKKQYLKSLLWNEELLTDEIFAEYSQDIMKDFLNLYLYDVNTKTKINKKQEEFLLFIYSKKTQDNLIDRFLYFFLWIGSYHETLLKLLVIFNKLDKYFINEKKHEKQSLLDSIIQTYDTFKFPKEEEDKEKVNGLFYRICESICHVIIEANNINFDEIDLNQFCTDLNEVAQILIQLNSTLYLGIKGQFSLITIAKIIEYSKKKNLNEKEFKKKLNVFIKNIYLERCHFLKNNFPQSIKCFNEQFNIIINLSDKLSMKIFVYKILQYFTFENYKLELIKKIFEYPKLIKYSSLFFNYIFLSQTIEPKRQMKLSISEDIKTENIKNFGKIKNENKNPILIEINKKAKNNEILKEILRYIFELRIFVYFENCRNVKFIKENPALLLTGLNFKYFLKTYNDIKNKNFGKLPTLGMIFCYSFLRCYLYYFVKLQFNNKEMTDFEQIHNSLMNISGSELGKMIILYISKMFILNNEKEYFINNYLRNESRYPWIDSIISQNNKLEFFPISQYENSKHLLFLIYSNINNDKLTDEFINGLEVIDIYYIINFAYNEMMNKIIDDNIEIPKILLKINEKTDSFNFNISTNYKIKKLINKITDIKFYKTKQGKKLNLDLIFNMLRLYVIGFEGIQKNLISSIIYSDKISLFIKIFYNQKSKKKF